MAYERFANGGLSSLAAGIDDSVLALTVKSAVGFPTGGNFRIVIESEIMLVTDVQGKTFTVTRAQEGTSAAAHLADVAVFHVFTAGHCQRTLSSCTADSTAPPQRPLSPTASSHLFGFGSLAQRDIEQFGTGLITARDAAGQAGRLYLPTEGLVSQDNGTLWDLMPLNRMAPPAYGDFTWVNQGSSTVADSKGMMVLTTATSASDSLRLLVKTAPSTPYTITVCMFALTGPYITSQAIPQYGICWRDSASGKILTYGPGMSSYYGAFAYAQWTNYSTLSAGQFMYSSPYAAPMWIRFSDDGTYRTVQVSLDGYKYELVTRPKAERYF